MVLVRLIVPVPKTIHDGQNVGNLLNPQRAAVPAAEL
jgi:hypothetical protein